MIRSATRMLVMLAVALGLAAPAVAAEELNLFAWSEYVPQSVLDGFTKETGIQVNYESYASNEEMLAKLMSGAANYDLIQPSEYVIEALVKEKQLVPLDHAKIPNLKNIGKEYWDQPHDPERLDPRTRRTVRAQNHAMRTFQFDRGFGGGDTCLFIAVVNDLDGS